MERAQEEGLVFNSAKCLIKQRSISFFGNTYTDNGITPDDDKVRDIQNKQTPENREDLLRFIGMMSYLSQFIPHFAEKAHTLRGLLKKDVPWMWDVDHEKSFDELKHAVSTSACLQYYDPTAPVQLEVDASMKGLGIALVQKGRPVAFGSKTLTECQSRYSNIEREMLAIVHGIQRYHTYLYGRRFKVITDHKPLVTICAKAQHAAPPRLQRMLLKIQGYNFEIEYRPGYQMILAGTLSRLPNPINNDDVDLDVRVDGLALEAEDPQHVTIALINFPAAKQQLLNDETLRDPVLNALKEVIYNGWPDNVKELPSDLRAYWSFPDELAVEAGVIFKGRQILVPPSMQKDILKQLHSGHQGVEKTRRLARESVYWVKINSDIENTCKSCESCQEQQDANRREPSLPHCLPARPWQHIATDLFQIHDRHYLLTVDRYSKYPLVDEMPVHITSRSVADKLSQYWAMFGRPDQILTDNGPQYTGQAFKTFTETWRITHVTSSPHYARSNGLAERYVRYIKATLKKSSDMQLALLNIRATPVDAKLPSPAEMLLGRPLATLLPSRSEPGLETHRDRMQERQTIMKAQHDKTSRKEELPTMYTGQAVRILNHQRKTWCPGKIVSKCDEPRSYVVETPNGTRLTGENGSV